MPSSPVENRRLNAKLRGARTRPPMSPVSRKAVNDVSEPARSAAQRHPRHPGTRRTRPRPARRQQPEPQARARLHRSERRQATRRPLILPGLTRLRRPGLEPRSPRRPRQWRRAVLRGPRRWTRTRGRRPARRPRTAQRPWGPGSPPMVVPVPVPVPAPQPSARGASGRMRSAPKGQAHMLMSSNPPRPGHARRQPRRTPRGMRAQSERTAIGTSMFHVKHPVQARPGRAVVPRIRQVEQLNAVVTWGRHCEAQRM